MIQKCFVFLLCLTKTLFGEPLYNENATSIQLEFHNHDLIIEENESKNVTLFISGNLTTDIIVDVYFTEIILKNISSTLVKAGENRTINLTLIPIGIGHTVLYANATPANMTDSSKAYIHVNVAHSSTLDYVSETVGWIYFIAWSVSFYPQTYMNFKRKSVIGLHFDFLALNVIGFLYYSVFNIGLYGIPAIERQYMVRHQFGVNPVQLNDVIFSIHAFFACIIQVFQCLTYDKGEQQVSSTARTILGVIGLATSLMLILAVASAYQWIDFLYFISYVKLFITIIKYMPQAYYNYRRKSTSGWSIGNVLLDCTGGTLSIAQMFLIAYNYSDWGSIFGDPTKFGLGLFSVVFDILFMIQHYVLYRNRMTSLVGSTEPSFHSPEHSLRESLITDSACSNYGTI